MAAGLEMVSILSPEFVSYEAKPYIPKDNTEQHYNAQVRNSSQVEMLLPHPHPGHRLSL